MTKKRRERSEEGTRGLVAATKPNLCETKLLKFRHEMKMEPKGVIFFSRNATAERIQMNYMRCLNRL